LADLAARLSPRAGAVVARAERRPLPVIALAALMVVAIVVLLHYGRDFSFYADEWSYILDRRTQTLDDFLEPHNEHLSAVPVAIYKVLFALVGLDNYQPYRFVLLGLHLTNAALVFLLARRRVGDWPAVVAAAFVLLLGQGWEDLLWPFQIGFQLALVGGLGALLALDRRDGVGDVAAAALLLVSVASSGTGIPFLAVAAIELAWRRADRRRLWVVAVPGFLYALWSLGYGKSALEGRNLPDAPEYAAETIAGTLGPLVGLGIDYGRPLAVAAAALLVWRLGRPGVPSPRAAGLVGGLLLFVATLGLSRADQVDVAPPDASRYVYPAAFLVVLIAVELSRGARIGRAGVVLVAAVALVSAVSNVSPLRNEGNMRRIQIDRFRAQLGATLIARDRVDPGFIASPTPPPIPAAQLAGVVDDLGSPAYSASDLTKASESARGHADGTLVGALRIAPAPAPGGPCASLARGGPGASTEIVVPPGGLRVVPVAGSRADVRLRRYAGAFGPDPTFVVERPSTIAIPRDRAPQPWRVQVTSPAAVSLCRIG
jgi:hypothetical protein